MLQSWPVVLPAASTLERVAASVAGHAPQELFTRIAARLAPDLGEALDALLQLAPGEARSSLFRLQAYPPAASAAAILSYVQRSQQAHGWAADRIDLTGLPPEMVRPLAFLTKRYAVQALNRFAPAKRRAMVAGLLVETEKPRLDPLVEMHAQDLTTMGRRARHAFEERHRQCRRRAQEGLATGLEAIEGLRTPDYSGEEIVSQVYRRIGMPRLRDAVDSCREFQRLGIIKQ